MGQLWDQGRNKKIPWKKWKWEHTIQILWHTRTVILKEKFIALQAYLKQQEKDQINNVTSHKKELEKYQQTKPKVSRSKEMIKIRPEINKIKSNKMMIQKINKSKSCSFKKINRIEKLLTRFIKKKREMIQINKSEMK